MRNDVRFVFKSSFWAIALIATCSLSAWAKPRPALFDYDEFERVIVLHDDRAKPLDTLARETMRLITSREYWSAKKAPHEWLTRDPLTNLISMVFQPDEWHKMPCVFVGTAEVKELLGMDSKAEWISYDELRADPGFNDAFREIRKAQMEGEESGMGAPKLSPFQAKISELHGKLNTLDSITSGRALRIVPFESAMGPTYLSLEEVSRMNSEEAFREKIHALMVSFTENKPSDFNAAASSFCEDLKGRAHDIYPTESVIDQELTYNTVKPFRKSWMYLLVGSILFAAAMGVASKPVYGAAWIFYLVGFAYSGYALYLRVAIAGRPPVSNMYESVVYMGWGVLLFAGIFEAIYRQRLFGLCGSVMGILVLIMADMLPFDPAISPLVPVLRSSYWLIVHVMMIVISYSAFALAMMLAHFSLFAYLFTPGKKELIRTSNNFVYRSLQVGVLLLVGGTILGGVWANESWGRFWGWDPKETWAFISCIGYLALLHARFTGWIGAFGMAVGSIIGFQLILMTWYGVNFILAAGLHSYGFGAGGLEYVVGFVLGEAAFMGLVAVRYKAIGFTAPGADGGADDEPEGDPQTLMG